MAEKTLRIKNIKVTNLFGLFNHNIPINTDEHVTIIHGPNGVGKTVLLRMVHSISKGDFSIFTRIPFDAFQLDFDDESNLLLRPSHQKREKKSRIERFTLSGPEGKNSEIDFSSLGTHERRFPLSIIDDIIPELIRIGPEEWLNRITGERLSLQEVLLAYNTQLPHLQDRYPEWFNELMKSLKIRFVDTDRLLIRSGQQARERFRVSESDRMERIYEQKSSAIPTVIEFSNSLASAMKKALVEHGTLSSSLDRTFPVRLLNQPDQPNLSEENLRKELQEIEKKRLRLMEAGLLDTEASNVQIPEGKIDLFKLNVLSIYAKDVRQKLEVFDDILEKIDLLREIVNKKFTHKTVSVNKDTGFVIKTITNHTLTPDSLSSGEQHELVLLYTLLFTTPKHSFVLIDEPEISLHLGWQQEFLRDLLAITKIVGFDVLIATHSPDIVNDRWDLTIELNGGGI